MGEQQLLDHLQVSSAVVVKYGAGPCDLLVEAKSFNLPSYVLVVDVAGGLFRLRHMILSLSQKEFGLLVTSVDRSLVRNGYLLCNRFRHNIYHVVIDLII